MKPESTLNICLDLLSQIFKEAEWEHNINRSEIFQTLRVNFIRLLPSRLESLDEFGDCPHEHAKCSGGAGFFSWWCPECGASNHDALGPPGHPTPNPESWKLPQYFSRLEQYVGDRDTAIQLEMEARKKRAELTSALRKIAQIMGPHYDADDKHGDGWSISMDPVAPLVALLALGEDIPLPNNDRWSELISDARTAFAASKHP